MADVRKLLKVDDANYLSTEEAAESLGIKPTAIRNYLCEGKLKTYKFKTLTLLSADEVHSWKSKRSKT